MTFSDRTTEFNHAAESVRVKLNTTKVVKRTPIQQKSQFNLVASKIGKELYDTSDKLAKLAKLARNDSIFVDPEREIEELTFIIKQSIHSLNKELALLRDFSKSSNNSSAQSHSDTIISFLNTKLASTTKDFTEVLQVRTGNLKIKQERQKFFTGSNASKQSTPTRSNSGTSVLYTSSIESLPDSPARTGGEVAIMMPQMMLAQQDDYTTSRAAAVENIERILVELGGIFQQLASLVAEQGDMLQRIDENIERSEQYVDSGRAALTKYLHNISSSRMLIVKLFLVLIVFAVIFIVFFV